MNRLFIAMVILSGLSSCSSKPTKNFSLSPAEFEHRAMATSNAVILDVRTPEEVKTAYIKGAINFDFNRPEFKILISGLNKTKPYFVYCGSGESCDKAAEMMRGDGFEK